MKIQVYAHVLPQLLANKNSCNPQVIAFILKCSSLSRCLEQTLHYVLWNLMEVMWLLVWNLIQQYCSTFKNEASTSDSANAVLSI